MTKDELVTLGLDSDLAQKVADLSAEELKGFIPKSRFNEVNESNKSLKEQIKERDAQLEALKKESGNAEELQSKIAALQEENKQAASEYESKISQLRLEHAVEAALVEAKAKNLKAVKALLELTDAEVDDNGRVKGLDKQLKKLTEAEDTAFLFDVEQQSGGNGNEGGGRPSASGISGMKPANPDNNGNTGTVSIGAAYAARYNNSVIPTSSNNNAGNTAQ